MGEGKVEVVRLGAIERHPNADSLSITQVLGGYPCIIRTGEFSEGDLAAYVPVDSIVPDAPEYAFLKGNRRIKAMRLRGIFSMGLLRPAPYGATEGDDVGEAMGVTRYEPPEPGATGYRVTGGEAESPPKGYAIPCYTDIDGYRRHRNVLALGEDVVITEKIHGANARYMHDGSRLWVGSRTELKRDSDANAWWRLAREIEMADRLAAIPMHVFFGELFGKVQDLKYGVAGFAFRVFDVFDIRAGCYLDHDLARHVAGAVGLEWVPELHRGPWSPLLIELAEGITTIGDAKHVREGIVIKPLRERHEHMGRVILKHHGEGYLTRKVAK